MRYSRLFQWLPAFALGLTLVSCGGDGDEGPVAAATGDASGGGGPQGTTLSATLTGDQENPPVVTGGIGTGTLTFNPDTLGVTGSVNLDGVSATVAHIHIGEVGVNGPIIVNLEQTSPGTWTVPAGATLSAEQVTALNNGGLYFNAHTPANPNGEVRGQIGREVFNVQLTPAQEVPPTSSSASGLGRLVLNPATRAFTASVTVTGMTTTAAHIHPGAVGVNGPVLVPLAESPAGSNVWVAASGATLDEAQLAQLRAGELYFNAHSAAFPNGEIRGQIGRRVGLAQLTQAEEVPPTGSAATGTGTLVIDPFTRGATGSIEVTGMATTAAHVHQAAPGVNGPIIVPLDNTGANVWSVPANSTLTAEQWLAFQQGNLYYNAHSLLFPNGEIRGQIN
jgi:riboflavin synthase alpha subunit